jgi:hypothetical protein
LPLKDNQLRAIGRVSDRFNDLEYAMNVLAWELINPNPNIGRIVLEGESFDRVLTRVRKLSDEVAREDRERGSRIQRWVSKVNELKRRRNNVVHSQIVLDMATLELPSAVAGYAGRSPRFRRSELLA